MSGRDVEGIVDEGRFGKRTIELAQPRRVERHCRMNTRVAQIVPELLVLAERKLVPEFFGKTIGIAQIDDLLEGRRIMMLVLLGDDDRTLRQRVVEIGAHL
ncbi:hypothetical protein ACVWZZ_001089 [Bradyrhizobium sp. LM6.10]